MRALLPAVLASLCMLPAHAAPPAVVMATAAALEHGEGVPRDLPRAAELYCQLARRGFAVRVLERAATFADVGAGLQLSPNAVRVLEGLGLGEGLDAIGARPAALRLLDRATGSPIATMPLGAAAKARWGAPYLTVHRADLHDLLAAKARALDAARRHDEANTAATAAFALQPNGTPLTEPGELAELRRIAGRE